MSTAPAPILHRQNSIHNNFNRFRRVTRLAWRFSLLALLATFTPRYSAAADIAAGTSGAWSLASTWVGNAVPSTSDNVFIGSNYPTGGADTVTVSLTQNASASSIYLGYSGASNGTLDLGNSSLSVNTLNIGNAGTGNITRGTGTFAAGNLQIATGNSLTFAAGDVTTNLSLTGNSTATTAAVGNITTSVSLFNNSTLTLGAALNLGAGYIDLQSGSTLNAQNNAITASSLLIGWNGSGTATLSNRGKITASNLFVGSQTFNLNATDAVSAFTLSNGSTSLGTGVVVSSLTLDNNSTATTAAVGNITTSVSLFNNSTLTLGAALNVGSNGVELQSGSTLNAQNNAITAGSLLIGWNGTGTATLSNRGVLTVSNLYVGGQTFNLNATDAVSNYFLSNGTTTLGTGVAIQNLGLYGNSTATTATTGNITSSVSLANTSSLTLGAPLNLGVGTVDIQGGTTLNAQNNAITAGSVYVGWNGSGTGTLSNRGKITATNLYVAGQTFTLNSTDAVTSYLLSNGNTALGTGVAVENLYLYGTSTVTTATTGNITNSVNLNNGSSLTLGAPLNLGTGSVDIQGGATLNAQNNAITAANVLIGWNGSGTGTLSNRGKITATNLYVAGQTFTLNSTDAVTSYLLSNGNTALGTGVAVENLYLYGNSTATTSNVGNITANATLTNTSSLTLGAPLNVGTGTVDIQAGTTLNAQNNPITAANLLVGWNGSAAATLSNRGTITATNLYVAGSTLNLNSSDTVTNFYLSNGNTALGTGVTVNNLYLYGNATATTSNVGNITANATLTNTSSLTLGAPLNVGTGTVDIQAGTTLNAQNNPITAASLLVGWNGSAAATLSNRGTITATNLYVAGSTLNLNSSDTVTNFYLSNGNTALGAGVAVGTLNLSGNSTATTSSVGNITVSTTLANTSSLTLGAPLNVGTGTVDVQTGATLNAQNNPITAGTVLVGWNGSGTATFTNDGAVTATNYYQTSGTTTLRNGNDTIDNITINGNGVLRVTSGQGTGLTLNGSNTSSLSIGNGSKLRLDLNGNFQGWIFRWQGDHVADLNAMITAGTIDFVVSNAGERSILFQSDGYTYLYQPVPEPGMIGLSAVSILVVGRWVRRKYTGQTRTPQHVPVV